ncbi:ParB/Srx family N-terminal domain-containing protein [Duganella vulcania]|uniref:ParB/Sulfiredoxin domain-containing protein n=1 Tax=Duganella vulcania TaxID=2692166 RepID=A0A845GEQ1_9BURK|nr:ParB/Srx family N-terminal domain-containing protein [Duganella vulcania]MYM92381.1 hypothetical protein [Duganella vulcania]
MTTDILVNRMPDGSYNVVSGHRRLQALLQTVDQVEVWDCEKKVKIIVHSVDGRMVALSEDAMDQLKRQTNTVIERARIGAIG